MNREFSRRCFVAGAMAASCAVPQAGAALGRVAPQAGKTLDIHVHLFGIGDNGSNCRLLKGTAEGPLFWYLSTKLRLRERDETIDEGYVLALAEQVEKSGLDRVVVLAQDAVYDDRGEVDWGRTSFYVPNDYLLDVVSRYPQRMIPCVSINPRRADAIPELERCVAKGARILKIHPPTQGVDLADAKRFAPFFRRCADLQVIVMVHTGHEHSAPIFDIELANPRKLVVALEQGCTVIGSGVFELQGCPRRRQGVTDMVCGNLARGTGKAHAFLSPQYDLRLTAGRRFESQFAIAQNSASRKMQRAANGVRRQFEAVDVGELGAHFGPNKTRRQRADAGQSLQGNVKRYDGAMAPLPAVVRLL